MAGGCERFVHETSTRIAAMPGFSVDVFANRWELADPRIRYHRVPMVRFPKFVKPWAFVRAAKRMIDRGGYDVVHAHLRTDFAHITTVHPAPHAFWVREVLGRRTLSLHDRTMIAMERQMLAQGAGRTFLPVSQMLLEVWRDEYGELPGEWRVQTPGVDTERFAPDPTARASLRRELGISNEECMLLFVGMNFEVKGLREILGGIAQARTIDPSIRLRLVVVGKGDRGHFQSLADRMKIGDMLKFAGVVTDRLPHYYAAADAFIMLSSFETFCMAAAEAIGAGLPIAITDKMGVRDLARGIPSAVILDRQPTAVAVSDAIASLVRLSRERLTNEGRCADSPVPDWEEVALMIADTYQGMAART
jgi:UDP-glucose:(heptosyl)LPS alpha-1,3-glucosyltransferase